jgi:hypothetical protein
MTIELRSSVVLSPISTHALGVGPKPEFHNLFQDLQERSSDVPAQG